MTKNHYIHLFKYEDSKSKVLNPEWTITWNPNSAGIPLSAEINYVRWTSRKDLEVQSEGSQEKGLRWDLSGLANPLSLDASLPYRTPPDVSEKFKTIYLFIADLSQLF